MRLPTAREHRHVGTGRPQKKAEWPADSTEPWDPERCAHHQLRVPRLPGFVSIWMHLFRKLSSSVNVPLSVPLIDEEFILKITTDLCFETHHPQSRSLFVIFVEVILTAAQFVSQIPCITEFSGLDLKEFVRHYYSKFLNRYFFTYEFLLLNKDLCLFLVGYVYCNTVVPPFFAGGFQNTTLAKHEGPM